MKISASHYCHHAKILLLMVLGVIPQLVGAGTNHKMVGRDAVTLFSGEVAGGTHVRFDLMPVRYPLPSGKDPAYQFIVNPPVTTNKVRYFSNDAISHILTQLKNTLYTLKRK